MPIILSYPQLGVLGQVGKVIVSASTTEVISSTAIEDMLTAAQLLAEQHRDAIEAPFHKQETRFSCVPTCLRMILIRVMIFPRSS